jgi:hypothetical protein
MRGELTSICLIGILTLAGCGPADGIYKVIVSGNVSYDGQPVSNGQITFYPADTTRGPVSTAMIKDGKYVADSKGGVPVGRHQVKIEGYRKPQTVPPGMSAEDLGREQYLPAKYNANSELTTEIKIDESPAVRDYVLK